MGSLDEQQRQFDSIEKELSHYKALAERRQQELSLLQSNFDDYTSSSRELEEELEEELGRAEGKISELQREKLQLQFELEEARERAGLIGRELVGLQGEIQGLRETKARLEEEKRVLEQENDELQSQERITKASEDDLRYRLEKITEEKVFLQQEYEELREEHQIASERSRAEIQELASEIQVLKKSSHDIRRNSFSVEASVRSERAAAASSSEEREREHEEEKAEMEAYIQELEEEMETLTEKLKEEQEKNDQLSQEMLELTDELMSRPVPPGSPTPSLSSRALEKTEREQFEQQVREHEEENAHLSLSLEEQRKMLSQLEERISQMEESAFLQREEWQTLLGAKQEELNEREEELAVLRAEVTGKSQELHHLRQSLQKMEGELTALRERERERRERDEARDDLQQDGEDEERERGQGENGERPSASSSLFRDDLEELQTANQKLEAEVRALKAQMRMPVKPLPAMGNGTIGPDVMRSGSSLSLSSALSEGGSGGGGGGGAGEREREREKENKEQQPHLETVTKLLKEQRKRNAELLSRLQELKGTIQVMCRVRPRRPEETEEETVVQVLGDLELGFYDRRGRGWRSFPFDHVFSPSDSQVDVFHQVEPLAVSVVRGFNACVLAYGQTGSGKTYTMQGPRENPGLNSLLIERIFELAAARGTILSSLSSSSSSPVNGGDVSLLDGTERRQENGERGKSGLEGERPSSAEGREKRALSSSSSSRVFEGEVPLEFSISISLFEIYNEEIRDLLSFKGEQQPKLEVRQDPSSADSVYIPDLTKERVSSSESLLSLFERGMKNRSVAATNIHEHSSRSHSVLIVEVQGTDPGGEALPTQGRLFLVDLAGSERVGKSGVSGEQLKEAQFINKSLSALGDVIEALDKKRTHVPYRNSKLTYLLKDALGGPSKTLMILTVCPTQRGGDETLFSLQFASRVRRVSLSAAQRTPRIDLKKLEGENQQLKAELQTLNAKKNKLEEALSQQKQEQTRGIAKMSTVLDVRTKSLDELKRNLSAQNEALKRTNGELLVRLKEEQEQRQRDNEEREAKERQLRKMKMELQSGQHDRESLGHRLASREAENQRLKAQLQELKKKAQEKRKRMSLSSSSSSQGRPGSARSKTETATQSSSQSTRGELSSLGERELDDLSLPLVAGGEETSNGKDGTRPLSPRTTTGEKTEQGNALSETSVSSSLSSSRFVSRLQAPGSLRSAGRSLSLSRPTLEKRGSSRVPAPLSSESNESSSLRSSLKKANTKEREKEQGRPLWR